MSTWFPRLAARMGALMLLSIGLAASPAQAQPSNDSRLTPTVIAALPFSDSVATIGAATVAPDDPESFCAAGRVMQGLHSVWYAYQASSDASAADRYVSVAALGSGDSIIEVFEANGSSIAAFPGNCNDDAVANGGSARIDGLPLARGQTYLIEVSYYTPLPPGATLQLAITPSPIYVVTKTVDTADGQCNSDCSLREAVIAGSITGGAVELPAGEYLLTIPGSFGNQGDLNIGIIGRGTSIIGLPAGGQRPVIRQTVQDRVIRNDSRTTLLLRDLVVTGGRAQSGSEAAGGGIYTLEGHLGGERIDVVDNQASGAGGGISGYVATIALRDSRVSGNSAGIRGGGLAFRYIAPSKLRIERSAFVENSAAQGGAIDVFRSEDTGDIPSLAVLLENLTVSSNGAINDAAVRFSTLARARVDVRHATFVDNNATGIAFFQATNADVVLERNAFGRNVAAAGAADCVTDASSAFLVRANTAEVPGNCPWPAADNDVVPAAGIGPLTDADGQSFHEPIVPGPLIDRDDVAGCASTDQRGLSRPVALIDPATPCDRGAIEAGANLIFSDGFE